VSFGESSDRDRFVLLPSFLLFEELMSRSADYFASPHWFTFLGYLLLFHEIGLDYTWSTYASEGGNFGNFHSHEMMKRLNAKIYAEARRAGG
jgi:hypothetical protein